MADQSAEDQLIARLAGLLPPVHQTTLTIGDDAAAIPQPGDRLLLVTTDQLMEDVHFRLAWGDLPALGWKALAQNLSDIAAMGGTPTHAVIAIGIPPGWSPDQVSALYGGLADLAGQAQVDIIGGDTIRSIGPLTMTLTVLGTVCRAELLTRSGARPGDALFVTGSLGRAAAGLHLLDTGDDIPPALQPAVQAQLRPEPRLAAARCLAQAGYVTAMMDLSDGVATDVHRLCHMSGVGVIIEDTLPIDPVVPASCAWLADRGVALDPVTLALTGGEDFELLFTAPAARAQELQTLLAPLAVTRIGTMTDSPDILLVSGTQTSPLPWGFTHLL